MFSGSICGNDLYAFLRAEKYLDFSNDTEGRDATYVEVYSGFEREVEPNRGTCGGPREG
jgi:hypothetical protein